MSWRCFVFAIPHLVYPVFCLIAAAIKYGTKQRGYPSPTTGAPRWKYTLGNLVFITDDTSTIEITSYCLPIVMPKAPMSLADIYDYEKTKDTLRLNPHLCTSHTVIVVDHSRFVRVFCPTFSSIMPIVIVGEVCDRQHQLSVMVVVHRNIGCGLGSCCSISGSSACFTAPRPSPPPFDRSRRLVAV